VDSACQRLLAAHDVPEVQARNFRLKSDTIYEGEGETERERESVDARKNSNTGYSDCLGPGPGGIDKNRGKGKSTAVGRDGLGSGLNLRDIEREVGGGDWGSNPGTAPQSLGSTGVAGVAGCTGSSPLLTFEEFSSSPAGIPLHAAYEGAKSALQENKATQRQITSMLNKFKACIDALQLQLHEGGEQEGERKGEGEGKGEEKGEGKGEKDGGRTEKEKNKVKNRGESKNKDKNKAAMEAVEAELAGIKKDYRLSSKELELCKVQVAEIQTLKKMALSALLRAFEAQNGT
jgi:hypothetical protein